MKKAKAARVPILENAFELNLPKLMRVAKATGSPRLVLNDGFVRTVAVLAETRLAVLLGGRQWVVDIVPVRCLQDRVRRLMACPRAHEGNFQSLYFRGGELACRHCHALRYRSGLESSKILRIQTEKRKILEHMGADLEQETLVRRPRGWRKKHLRQLIKLEKLTQQRVVNQDQRRQTNRV